MQLDLLEVKVFKQWDISLQPDPKQFKRRHQEGHRH